MAAATAPTASNFTTVRSFMEIPEPPRLEEGEAGWLMLDIDETLIKFSNHVQTELFYEFISNQLFEEKGKWGAPHFPFSQALRAGAPVSTTEPVAQIISRIETYRKAGWEVQMLTSRSEGDRDKTFREFDAVGLGVLKECPICFKGGDKKGPALEKLIAGRHVRVHSVDDKEWDGKNILETLDIVKDVAVNFFHYAPEKPEFTQEMREIVIAQLHAFKQDKPFGNDVSPEEIVAARAEFNAKGELTGAEMLRITRSVAEEKGLGF